MKIREKINMNVKTRLVELRENKNVTQTTVALETGISRPSIAAYEKGVSIPDLEKLYILAEYYGVSCDYLLGRNEGTEHDVNYIIEKTGLSETAINKLTEYNSDKKFNLNIFAINQIIEYDNDDFLTNFAKYISITDIDNENAKSVFFNVFPELKDEEINIDETKNNIQLKLIKSISLDDLWGTCCQKSFEDMTKNIKNDKQLKRNI